MCYAPGIRVKGANAVTLLLAASSSYVDYHDVSGDPAAKDRKVLRDLDGKSYQDILRDHVADFGALFNRVSLDLGGEDTSAIPTDRRFALFAGGKDRDFPALFFQYGRYLMISSSRKGGVPANLQGLWNEDFGPAWNGGYTTNINFEMNYWPSDLANLSECRIPQLETIRNMRGPGGETARLNFGADGWTCNLNTDIWLASAPIYGAYWGTWQGATAWYGCDLWDHYLFTRDPAFLEGYYPLMRDAVLFFDQTLVRHPKYGWLVTNPSSSPENGPGGDPAWTRNPDGTRIPPVGICAGPTCDNAMIGELFRHFIEASTALGKDGALRESVSRKLPQLPPYRIGRYGQLQEWLEDLDNPNDRHRHNSQLWGLYPGTSIDPLKTPRLAEAARVVLDHKGDESTGWSLAWRANLWARLRDGDRALKLVTRLLRLVDSPDYVSGPGGTYANLMDSHPPFQIDGNFGGTAAIAEMLLQSHNGYLEFLPALPRAWDRGTVSGLKARGAFTVAVSWENGRATSAALSSEKGLPCVLRSASGIVVTAGNERMAVTREGDHLYRFRTQPGRTYRISFS
jgi:alpha-L-fucosidase 2